MQIEEGRPAWILLWLAKVVVGDGGHTDDGLVALDLLCQGFVGGEEVIGRRKPIAGRIDGGRQATG